MYTSLLPNQANPDFFLTSNASMIAVDRPKRCRVERCFIEIETFSIENGSLFCPNHYFDILYINTVAILIVNQNVKNCRFQTIESIDKNIPMFAFSRFCSGNHYFH